MSPSAPGCLDCLSSGRTTAGRGETARHARRFGAFFLGWLLVHFGLGVDVLAETSDPVPAYAPYAGADWPTADARDYGYDTKSLSEAIERIGAEEGVYSALLVRGGELIAEQYFREGTRTKIHNLKSASKSIVSALVGLVIADGDLSLGDSVVEVLDVQGVEPDRRAITVRDVLMMASGLESTSYEAYNAWIAGSDWVRGALRQERLVPPGTEYRYSTGNTHLLSALVRRASGRSTRSFAQARLFDPLDIEIGGWETDPQGTHIGGNNLALTPRDMAKFGELFLRGGRWGDQQVVPLDWVRESTRIQIAADHEHYGDYGYQWFVSRRIPGDFVAVGFGGQYIYVSPAYDAVVVITSTLESKGREWEHRVFDVIEQDLLRADGVRATSRRASGGVGSTEPAYGPAGATVVASSSPGPSESESKLEAELESARSQVATLAQRVSVLESDQEQEAERVRQRLQRADSDRQQLELELERSRRALEESGKERARLAQLLEEAERREAVASQEATEERQRATSRAASEETEQTRLRQLLAVNNDQIAALRSVAQTRDLELERARAELARLERRVEDRDATVKDRDAVLDQQLQRFEAERSDLETQLAEERGRADQTLREMQRMRQAESALRADLESRDRGLATARERAQAAEQALEARDVRLASLQTDLETLRAQARADAADREELTQRSHAVQERLEIALAETTRLEAALSRLSGSDALATSRAAELDELRASRDAEAQGRGAAEEQLRRLRSSLADTESRAASLEADLDRLRGELSAQERSGSEAAARSAELARLRGEELSELGVTLRAEIARREQADAEVAALRSSLAEQQEQSGALRGELDRVQERLAAERRDGSDAASLAGDLEQAQQRISALQKEVAGLEQLQASQRRETEQLNQRLGESQRASTAQAQQIIDLRAEVRAAQEEKDASEAETRRLRDELRSSSTRRQAEAGREAEALETSRARVEELESSLSAAKSERDALRAQASELAAALSEAKDRSEQGARDRNAELDQLRSALSASTDRVADLERRLGEVRRTSESRRVALEKAEAAVQAPRDNGRIDELLAQLAARDRSMAALQQELSAARIAAAASGSEALDAERVRLNYEALVAESEMLARRAGEQGRRIAELEQRLAAANSPQDLDRELQAVRAEVERLLNDRRLSEVLRGDLVRLRRVVVALQGAREKND